MTSPAPEVPRTNDAQEILDLVVSTALASLPGFDQVGVWTYDDQGVLATTAAAGELVHELDRLQLAVDEGPCLDALRVAPVVVAAGLAHERRQWSGYVPHAVELGVRAQLSVRLAARGDGVAGGLNVYSTESEAVAPEVVVQVQLFAAQAALALRRTHELDGLRSALVSRTTIGQAVGLLMAEYVLTAEAAFAYLVRTSSRSNVKLRDVAARIVEEADARAEAQGSQDTRG